MIICDLQLMKEEKQLLEPLGEALAIYGLDWEEIKHKNTL